MKRIAFLALLFALSACAPQREKALAWLRLEQSAPPPVMVVAYPAIAETAAPFSSMMTLDELKAHLAWLHATNYRVVSLDEALLNPAMTKTVLLYFSGNDPSMIEGQLVPLLRAYHYPALIADSGGGHWSFDGNEIHAAAFDNNLFLPQGRLDPAARRWQDDLILNFPKAKIMSLSAGGRDSQ